MFNFFLIFLLSVAFSSASNLGGEERRKLMTSAQFSEKILALHNQYRSQIALGQTSQPQAQNMLEMKWDDGLAAVAQAYANKCTWAPSSGRTTELNKQISLGVKTSVPSGTPIGENLYLVRNKLTDPSPLFFGVHVWYVKHMRYIFSSTTNYGTDRYQQLVSANSGLIGCAFAACDTLNGVSNYPATILVCNYAPAADLKARPYIAGTPCAQCPKNANVCSNGLCSAPITATQTPVTEPNAIALHVAITLTVAPGTIPPKNARTDTLLITKLYTLLSSQCSNFYFHKITFNRLLSTIKIPVHLFVTGGPTCAKTLLTYIESTVFKTAYNTYVNTLSKSLTCAAHCAHAMFPVN